MMRLIKQLDKTTPNNVASHLVLKSPTKQMDQILRWAGISILVLFLSIAAATFAATFSGGVWAQAATPQPAEEPAEGVAAQDVSPDEVNTVARELWCPLCSGVRLDSCELKACDQMKDVIAIKLSEGEDTTSIKAYFVEQYGPQVLGEPPREGFNWLAWILPFLALIGGGVFLLTKTRQMIRPAASAPAQTPRAAGQPDTPQDEYDRKLDEELAKYG
jgi:cytochrome c-type biogenesis protein CcmH